MAERKAPKRTRASKETDEKKSLNETTENVEAMKEVEEVKNAKADDEKVDEVKEEEKEVIEESKEDSVDDKVVDKAEEVSDENDETANVSEDEMDNVQKASETVFGEDETELPVTFEKPSEEEETKTQVAEQEDLAKKIAGTSFMSDEEELLDHKLLEAGKQKKRELYFDDVIPLHDSIQYESTSIIRKREFLNLVESMRTGKTLYGVVTGCCVYEGHITAIVKYGDFFRILIPFEFFTKLTKEDEEFIASRGGNKNASDARKRHRIEQRIMSEVDFIVGKIDEENGLAVANRLTAMSRKMVNFYFSKNRSGDYNINEGTRAEARIVRATSNYLVAELYGMEYRLSAEDLSAVRIPDVSEMFPVGSTAPVKIIALDRKKENKHYSISCKISIKEGMEDRRLSCFNFYARGSRVLATVTGVETYGIFCRLEGKGGVLDVLCHFPNNDYSELPSIGSLVSVLITGKDEENLRLNGVISRVLKYAN